MGEMKIQILLTIENNIIKMMVVIDAGNFKKQFKFGDLPRIKCMSTPANLNWCVYPNNIYLTNCKTLRKTYKKESCIPR